MLKEEKKEKNPPEKIMQKEIANNFAVYKANRNQHPSTEYRFLDLIKKRTLQHTQELLEFWQLHKAHERRMKILFFFSGSRS